MPHLDDVTGALARVPALFRGRVRNTLDRLEAYEGVGIEAMFPAPAAVPDVRRRLRWQLPGLVSEDLRFRSLHDPLEPAFRRHYRARRRRIHTVYARRIRPAGARGRPRLLYLHGYMQPETLLEEFGLLVTMARALDMEVVQLQPPYHGRRKPRSSRFDGELYWTADLVRSVESLRQTLLDARALLAWMREESPTPVGVAGLSLGGALTASLTCLEPHFAFSAPFIAHMDLGALVADAPVLATMRGDLARFGWTPADFAAFTDRMGWTSLAPVLPASRIHLFASDDDRFFRPELVAQMWKRWGEPDIAWYPGSHMTFLAHLPDAIARLRRFVDAIPFEQAHRSARRHRAVTGLSRAVAPDA
ncbi:MAG: alpha/beta hydrolase family protein [Myxococcota bacterium]|nr:alpha/beta hydrolase family protein [Myxococcota bacterium]